MHNLLQHNPSRGPKPLPLHLSVAAAESVAKHAQGEAGWQDYRAMLAGIKRYHACHIQRYTQHLTPVAAISGSTIYAHPDAGDDYSPQQRPLLLIPSMINSPAIFDILPGCSLLALLNSCGIPAYMLDWGDCYDDAGLGNFTSIAKRLNRLVAKLADQHNLKSAHGLGYCMGGHFLAAANTLEPARYASLTFLSTPWDFAASDYLLAQYIHKFTPALCAHLSVSDYLSPYWLHSIFALLEPEQVLHKFARFASMAHDSYEAALFVAVQDWLNTTACLPHDLAWTIVTQLVERNKLAKGEMLSDDICIQPRTMHNPATIIAPQHDRIASPQSSKALYRQMPEALLYAPDCGHIAPMCNVEIQNALWPLVVDRLKRIDSCATAV